MKRITAKLALLLSAFWLSVTVGRAAEEQPLYYPNSKAPMEAGRAASPDIAVTHAEAEEMRSELGGVLYMAQRKYTYSQWPGKEMSDCRRASSKTEDFAYVCQMIMGHVSADYYFYPDSGAGPTLQQVDAHFQAADPSVLRYLRRPPQALFGEAPTSGCKLASKEVGWDGRGNGWVWNTGSDVAFLYMDMDQPASDGEGTARFQWRRSPLASRSTH